MAKRSAGSDNCLLPARTRVVIAWICALVFAAGIGDSSVTSTGQAKTPTHPATSRHAHLRPAAATGALGLDLMRTLPPGNLVLSPDSVAAALAMTGSGAAGKTAARIASTLHLRSPAAFAAMGNLQGTIANEQAAAAQGDPKAPTLEMADALFLQDGFPIEPAFVSALQQHFGAAPQTVDFSGDPAGSVKTINAWVSERTSGIIPQLLETLSPETRLALANAVYLKARWLYPFKARDTSPAPFYEHHRYDNHKRNHPLAQFMHELEWLRYGSGRGYAAVDLPYRASTLSLLVVLPVGRSLGALQHQLEAGKGLSRLVHGLSRRSVELSLPRFHLNTHTMLNSALKALGMGTAFSEAANFSRMTTAAPLKIGVVEHAADFKVEEAGTEAAAATVVGVEMTSAKVLPPNTVVFNANHPFLFFLRDDRTGTVLFAGRLTNPAAAGI